MNDDRTLHECLVDLPDVVVLALCLVILAYAVGEWLARGMT